MLRRGNLHARLQILTGFPHCYGKKSLMWGLNGAGASKAAHKMMLRVRKGTHTLWMEIPQFPKRHISFHFFVPSSSLFSLDFISRQR